MKNRIKKSLKIGILLLGISLILTNCNEDDQSILDESQLEQTTPLVLNQRIAFDQTQHFNRLQSKINKTKSKANDFNSQNRTDNEDIEILTDEVLYITYASTHTYSFKVLREQPQAFIENIVLHYNIETDDYNEYLVQYHIPAEEFVNLHNGDLLQSSENVTIIDLENGFFDNHIQARGCVRSCSTIFVSCSSGAHNSDNVGEWGGCTEDTRGGTLPYAYQSCSTNCDQDNEITAPDGPSGGGGGGGNTTVVTDPLPTEPCDMNNSNGIGVSEPSGECIDAEEAIKNGLLPPSCEAFDYSDVNSNWQAAATKNIIALIGYYDVGTGEYNTASVLFPQPIYFEMPKYSSANGGCISSGRAAELTAKALYTAIKRAKLYFLSTNATSSQVQAKLWEYIRDEMTNGSYVVGGKASFTPPLGFSGGISDYESYWFIEDDCD